MGDGLATYFEARTCYASQGDNLVLMKPSLAGLGIARLCFETIRDYAAEALQAVKAKAVTTALENTVEATIYMSGVGAESGGLAAAHAIHNGMTAVHDPHGAQHGEKVAFGLVAQRVLEGAPRAELEQVIRIIKSVELPLTLADLGLKNFDKPNGATPPSWPAPKARPSTTSPSRSRPPWSTTPSSPRIGCCKTTRTERKTARIASGRCQTSARRSFY